MTILQCPLCGTLVSVTAASAPWLADGVIWCGMCDPADRGVQAWFDSNPDIADQLGF